MQAGTSSARETRSRHRHELRTVTYVTLDQGNGGIIRNLTHDGIAVQVVAAVRPRQQLRVRFELNYPRLRVETRGEVVWATFSGQCGIRFLDLPPRMIRQIDEWIFGNLLEGISLHSERDESAFADPILTLLPLAQTSLAEQSSLESPVEEADGDDDGLMVSAAPLKVIELPARPELLQSPHYDASEIAARMPAELDWLSQPLSSRGLAWTVNTLVVVASLLLFVLVFLSVTREAPKWPVEMTAGAAIFVVVLYWGFFRTFGGSSLGARLASLAESGKDNSDEGETRFR